MITISRDISSSRSMAKHRLPYLTADLGEDWAPKYYTDAPDTTQSSKLGTEDPRTLDEAEQYYMKPATGGNRNNRTRTSKNNHSIVYTYIFPFPTHSMGVQCMQNIVSHMHMWACMYSRRRHCHVPWIFWKSRRMASRPGTKTTERKCISFFSKSEWGMNKMAHDQLMQRVWQRC